METSTKEDNMKPIQLYDSHDSEKTIEVEYDDVPELLDSLFAEFGYDVLEEYFKRFDKGHSVFLCIIPNYSSRPDCLVTISR